MIDLIEEPLDSRVVWHINSDPISDGGQYDMAVNLLEVSSLSSPLEGWWRD
jgi:bleomycin hydrolase